MKTKQKIKKKESTDLLSHSSQINCLPSCCIGADLLMRKTFLNSFFPVSNYKLPDVLEGSKGRNCRQEIVVGSVSIIRKSASIQQHSR
jgi:hypothetical protein